MHIIVATNNYVLISICVILLFKSDEVYIIMVTLTSQILANPPTPTVCFFVHLASRNGSLIHFVNILSYLIFSYFLFNNNNNNKIKNSVKTFNKTSECQYEKHLK